jgi:hypothetical protein
VIQVQHQDNAEDPDEIIRVAANPDPEPDPVPAPPTVGPPADNACDAQLGEGAQSSALAFGAGSPWDAYPSSTVYGIASPRFNYPDATTILRWGYLREQLSGIFGTGGWGYRHIKARHGYGFIDDLETATALEDPKHIRVPTADDLERTGFLSLAANATRWIPLVGSSLGQFCVRVVVLQSTPPDVGVPPETIGPAGVWTSFSMPDPTS